jgi:hypothetical protein
MTKVDQLIDAFKELREELNKNMNGSMNPGMHKPNATTGTSGGQGGMYKDASPAAQDMQMIKYDKNGQWSLNKSAFEGTLSKVDPQENINIPHPQGKAKMANGVNKDESYMSTEGKNREANPKLRASDLGPGGKVHMVKDEGTNEEAGTSHPHNKGKFKVESMAPEKESKKASASGLPYSGKDKDIKKGEGGAQCDRCGKPVPVPEIVNTPSGDIHCERCAEKVGHVKKGEHGKPVQGNEAKGFDENKAPGRGNFGI